MGMSVRTRVRLTTAACWIVWAVGLCPAGETPPPALHLPDTIAAGRGWSAIDPQKVYNRTNVYEYLDGGADPYLIAGMAQCLTRRYTIRGGASTETEVNVYDLEKPLHAFGLFRDLTAGDSAVPGIGAECAWKERRLALWKGRFYVEVVDKSIPQTGREGIKAVAVLLAKILPGGEALPDELAQLPDSLKIEGSERYARKDFLAHGFMQDVLSAEYTAEGGVCVVFIMSRTSEAEAVKTFTAMQNGFGALVKISGDSPLRASSAMATEKITAVRVGARIIGARCECKPRMREQLLAAVLQFGSAFQR